jgi:hypothetical protein
MFLYTHIKLGMKLRQKDYNDECKNREQKVLSRSVAGNRKQFMPAKMLSN